MTVVAGPGSLEHGAPTTAAYNEDDSDMDAEGEEDSIAADGETTPTKEEPSELESDEIDSDTADDAEADASEGAKSPSGSPRRKNRQVHVEQAGDVDIEDDAEPVSSSAEEEDESEESDSEAESDEVAEYDGASEAAETAASAEVQARNNCV